MKLWRGLCQAMDFAALEKGKTMAKEYIEREATIELLRSIGSRDYRREKGTIQEAIKLVSFSEYTPAADVAPVRHAKWVDNHCTACGMMPMGDEMWKNRDFEPPLFERFMDYCPSCGALMDKEE